MFSELLEIDPFSYLGSIGISIFFGWLSFKRRKRYCVKKGTFWAPFFYTIIIASLVFGFGPIIVGFVNIETEPSLAAILYVFQVRPHIVLGAWLEFSFFAGLPLACFLFFLSLNKRRKRDLILGNWFPVALMILVAEIFGYTVSRLLGSPLAKSLSGLDFVFFFYADIIGAFVASAFFGIYFFYMRQSVRKKFSRKKMQFHKTPYFKNFAYSLVTIAFLFPLFYFSFAHKFSAFTTLTVATWETMAYKLDENFKDPYQPLFFNFQSDLSILSGSYPPEAPFSFTLNGSKTSPQTFTIFQCKNKITEPWKDKIPENCTIINPDQETVLDSFRFEMPLNGGQALIYLPEVEGQSNSIQFLKIPNKSSLQIYKNVASTLKGSGEDEGEREPQTKLNLNIYPETNQNLPELLFNHQAPTFLVLRPFSETGENFDLRISGNENDAQSMNHFSLTQENGPELIILFDKADKRFTHLLFENIQSIQFLEPNYSLRVFASFPTGINDFSTTGITGEIKVQNQNINLVQGDKILMGNARLSLNEKEDQLIISGKSSYINLNGEVLNQSIWNRLSTEIVAVILAALISLLVNYLPLPFKNRNNFTK